MSHTFPRINNLGNVIDYDTMWIKIYFKNGIEMYQIPYSMQIDDGSPTEMIYYIIWKRGDSKGLQYYLGDPTIRPIDADSAIKGQWPSMQDELFEQIKDHGKLVSKEWEPNGQILKTLYSFDWMKGNIPMKGTMQLSYSRKLNDINFTFNQTFDTIPQMKLFKVDIKNEQKYVPEYKINLDAVEMLMKFQLTQDFDRNEIKALFKRFESDSGIYL